jgi:hypothetical protein
LVLAVLDNTIRFKQVHSQGSQALLAEQRELLQLEAVLEENIATLVLGMDNLAVQAVAEVMLVQVAVRQVKVIMVTLHQVAEAVAVLALQQQMLMVAQG